MRRLCQLTIISVLLFISCKENQNRNKTASKAINSLADKESTYAKEDFRRFTYFLQSDNPKVSELLRQLDWEQVTESAKNYGIYQVSCYKNNNDYFFILDAEPTLDSKTMMESFEQLEDVRFLVGKLNEIGVTFPSYDSALERMYKLDQKVVYNPMEGQLKTDMGPRKRVVWTLLLKEDPVLMAEYKKAHSMGHAWPQITKNMKSIGVKDMEIYLHGTQAILIMDTKPDFDMEKTGPIWQKLPKENEWQDYVSKFQRTQPGSSILEKWKDMEKL